MTQKILACLLLSISLYSCKQSVPVVNLAGDSSVANRGETVSFTADASNERKIKIFNVSGTLYYEVEGSSIIYTQDLGYLYEGTEEATSVSGTFNYTIPYIVDGDSLIGGDYDYIEFIAYCETSKGQASTNFNVQINP
jgi:hypothetical protein